MNHELSSLRGEREMYEPLALMDGERPVNRFESCDEYLRTEGAAVFFGSARLSIDFRMYIVVVKKALGKIPLTDDEKLTVGRWNNYSHEEIVEASHSLIPPLPSQIAKLRLEGDPIIHILDQLEDIREIEYPDLTRDVTLHEKVYAAYELVINSAHGIQST